MERARKILVIDDSEVLLKRIKAALDAEGYDVATTTQVVGNARYLHACDLVILDQHMPGLDGTSVLASMRAVAGTAKKVCPIFLYTSDASVAARHAELGFDGVFHAKGDEASLVRQVAALFRIMSMRALKAQKDER